MWCDFHVHSTFSDGRLTIPALVDLYGRRGFGAIAITDHVCEEKSLLGLSAHWLEKTLTAESYALYMQVLTEEAERAWDQYRMILLPGLELTKNSLRHSNSAHIVALGAHEFISADDSVEEILREIRSQGGLSIAAHPVHTGKLEPQTYHLWNRRRELSSLFDTWEVASGRQFSQEVARSGLPMIANSDLHHPRQMSSWKTILNCERHPEAILRAIRRQEVQFKYFEDRDYERSSLVLGSGRNLSLTANEAGVAAAAFGQALSADAG